MKGPVGDFDAPSASSHQRDVDFSEYVWMGEEMEEFDKKCLQEFCEQEFIESCFEELFEAEDRFAEEVELYLGNLTADQVGQLVDQLNAANLSCSLNEINIQETEKRDNRELNPDAPEFVPTANEESDSPYDQ